MMNDNTITVDRSTLERWANCPAQARLMDGREFNSQHTEVGQAVHDAISDGVALYLESDGHANRLEVVDQIKNSLQCSRPDIQPKVIDACIRSLYGIASMLLGYHADNVLRFDGGQDERCGQLAAEFKTLGKIVVVTSELDLLFATSSPELLRECDWKSGGSQWTELDVGDSFQFQTHAWLVFENYPSIDALDVCVWNTQGYNASPKPVRFHRKYADDYAVRIQSAASLMIADTNQAFPFPEKCSLCPVASECPAAIVPRPNDSLTSPSDWVDALTAIEAEREALIGLLKRYIEANNVGHVEGTSAKFGRDKPPKTKPRASWGVY